MNSRLESKLKKLPSSPGVYFHKNVDGEVIYVGKASVLKNRVRQYFQNKKNMDAKTLALVNEIDDVEWIITDSEVDALFLESEMIKRYMPRYNILLRDDKAAVYIRINLNNEIPTVSLTRHPSDDHAEYIGPFYSSLPIKNALRYLRKSFPYFTNTKGSKLNRQIGLEPDISNGTEEYKKSLRQLISYLKGNRTKVINELEKEMKQSAKNQEFEKATELRNRLYNLKELKKQAVFNREEFLDINRDQGLKELQELLNLKSVPRRIEGYDISHHGGKNNTGSMVVFTNGIADKSQYRKFRLKATGNNDYEQMNEIINRRLKHLTSWGKPDVVMIDGGKGQLSAVADPLKQSDIAFFGRMKSGDHTRNASVVLVVPTDQNNYRMVPLDSNSHLAKLVARIDDEAHRFAINYHTLLKRKNMLK